MTSTFGAGTFGDGTFGSGTFGDPSGSPRVCAAGYEMVRDGGDILNDIQLARAGGTMRRYIDTTSVSLYQQRTFSRSDYVCETDAQIDILANRMLSARAPGQARIPKLTIAATDDLATWQFLLAVDYGWRVTVHYEPDDLLARGGASGWTREMHVQGVSHSITPSGWTCELQVDDVGAGAADAWGGDRGWDRALWTVEV